MITIIFLLLLVVSIVCGISKHYKLSLFSLVIFLIIFILATSGILPTYLLDDLQSYPKINKPEWHSNNAIILLGSGTVSLPNGNIEPNVLSYSRITEAARLYLSCKETQATCKIIISGGDAARNGDSEAAVYKKWLAGIHINDTDIILEDKSLNTFKNAEYTSAIIKRNKFDNLFLVTSAIHLKRALLYFSYFDIYAIPAPADYLQTKVIGVPLGYYLAISDFAVHEYLGVLRYHVYNYLGLNPHVARAGAV